MGYIVYFHLENNYPRRGAQQNTSIHSDRSTQPYGPIMLMRQRQLRGKGVNKEEKGEICIVIVIVIVSHFS